MKRKFYPFRLLILLFTFSFQTLRSQETGYEVDKRLLVHKIADVSMPEGSDPFAIAVTGIGFNADETRLSVASNNSELIQAIEIQPSSNGRAYIQYALKKGVSGSAVITVKAADANGLQATKNFSITVYARENPPVVPAAVSQSIRLEPYPNPAVSKSSIRFSTKDAKNHAEVSVYNIHGQKIKTLFAGKTEPGKIYLLNFSKGKHAGGAYMVQAVSGKETTQQQLIIQ